MKKIRLFKAFFFLGIAISVLAACGTETLSVPTITESPLAVATTLGSVSITLTISPTKRVSRPSKTPTPTIDPTELAIYNTEATAREQSWNDKATKVAQFFEVDPATCNNYSTNAIVNSSDFSPDKNWIATDCPEKLIVQNKVGTRWVLNFIDFLSPASPTGMSGQLFPKFWSTDGEYLYFTTRLGYSGGGNQCFPGFGDYGLFRLNLRNGSWVTLVAPTDSFPGYKVEFAPTGRRYATDMHGIMITDINTGEVITIPDTYGPEALSWSPDGMHLAYSLANCGDELVQTSSIYVWVSSTNQTQKLFTTDGILLRSETWIDNSTLKITGEKYDDFMSDYVYTIYVFDIAQNKLLFSGTATPSP